MEKLRSWFQSPAVSWPSSSRAWRELTESNPRAEIALCHSGRSQSRTSSRRAATGPIAALATAGAISARSVVTRCLTTRCLTTRCLTTWRLTA